MVLGKVEEPILWRERIALIVVGHSFKQFEENVFDYILYPLAIAGLGGVAGGFVMTVASALECWLFIRFYDWSKKDWLGLELLKEVRDGEERTFFQRIAQKGDWLAFLFMSFTTDPFMTTVYMRKGREEYNGLSSRDWKIFWASVVVGNVGWTIIVTLAITGFSLLYRWLGFN